MAYRVYTWVKRGRSKTQNRFLQDGTMFEVYTWVK